MLIVGHFAWSKENSNDLHSFKFLTVPLLLGKIKRVEKPATNFLSRIIITKYSSCLCGCMCVCMRHVVLKKWDEYLCTSNLI